MSNEPLSRNRYSEPPFTEGDFSARNFDEDFNDYHLPLARMQLANFQGAGIAQGLEVSGMIGGTTLTIHPGVAVDHRGQIISLATEGQADIGNNPFSEEHEVVSVPVRISLNNYILDASSTTCYLTIQFSEILRFDEGPLGRYIHAPWIRLQPLSGEDAFEDNGLSIILAQVTVNADGTLQSWSAEPRQLLHKSSELLELLRPRVTEDSITQVSSGKFTPAPEGGLHITVPAPANSIRLAQENQENFAKFEVKADEIRLGQRVTLTETLQINGNVRAEGTIVSNLSTQELSVSQDAEISQKLTVNQLSVRANTALGGDLKVTGNLEVQGNVIARDTEHIAGHVQLGDEDTDEIKVAGEISTGHSSDSLRIKNDLHIISLEEPATIKLQGAPSQGFGKAQLEFWSNPEGHPHEWRPAYIASIDQGNWTGGLSFHVNGVGRSNRLSDTEVMRLINGRVGIGRTNPRSTLDVKGTIRANAFEGSINATHINAGQLALDRMPTRLFEVKKFSNLGAATDYRTNFSTSQWICTIAGFISGRGNIQQSDAGRVIEVYMEPKNGYWYIRTFFRTHSRELNWTVWVLALRQQLGSLK